MKSPTSASDATPKFGSSLFDDDLPELAELEPKTSQGSSMPDLLGIEGLDELLPPIEGDHEAITLDAAKHALDDAPENQQYRVPCPTCRTPHYVVLSQKGTMVKCPDCYSEFKIPGPPPGWKPGKTPAKQIWGTNLASVSDHETQRENLRVKQKADELLSKAQTELADEEIEDLYTSDFDTKGFFQRTFGFVLDPIAVMQVVLYAVAFSGLLGVFEFGRQKILDTSVRENIGYAFISFISVPLLFVIIAFPLFSAAMAVLQAAANRQPKVKDWPGLNFLDDMGEILVFISAFIASVLPGLFVGWLIGQSGGLGWMVSLSVTFTTFLFFPVLLLSMLDNGSPFQPFSISVFASLKEAAEAWGGYYMKTIAAYGSLLVASFLLHQMGPAGMAIYGFLIPWVIFFTCQQLGVVASQISEHLSVEFSKGEDESEESQETESNQS